MLMQRCFLRILFIASLALTPFIAHAVLQDEIQVYDDEINAKDE